MFQLDDSLCKLIPLERTLTQGDDKIATTILSHTMVSAPVTIRSLKQWAPAVLEWEATWEIWVSLAWVRILAYRVSVFLFATA